MFTMKKLIYMMLGTFLISGIAFAQESDKSSSATTENTSAAAEDEVLVNHTVAMGETVALISKKYLVSPQHIYEYNEDATEGISYNMVLRIPMHKSFKSKKSEGSKSRKDTSMNTSSKETASVVSGKFR